MLHKFFDIIRGHEAGTYSSYVGSYANVETLGSFSELFKVDTCAGAFLLALQDIRNR